MSSELISRPSTSKMQARTGREVEVLDMADAVMPEISRLIREPYLRETLQ